MFGLRSSAASARTTKHRFRRLRRTRSEAGFTLIEVLLAGIMLGILSVPISAVLASSAAISKLARERTAADELAQTQVETIRTLSYSSVGIVHGNPPGVLAASTSTTLPSGEAVTIATQVAWVSDTVPGNPYTSHADYKRVVLTVTRNSDGTQLAQESTFVSSASAPPLAGTGWVQIQRTVVDAVNASVLAGASVNLTGGPDSENRTDTSDVAGNVLFPALDSTTTGTPVYTLATTYPPNASYKVFPDDISPGGASSIAATPGAISTMVLRMYLPTSLTVNVQTSAGAAYLSGATVSLDSSRCGVQTQAISSGQSSVTFTQCWSSGTEPGAATVPLPPNVLAQTPADSTYYVTAWSTTNTTGNWSTGTAVAVPSNYPTTLTQSVNVKMVSATFPYNATPANSLQKNIVVTVKKAGVSDTNARVEVTGAPTGISPGIDLFGTTNGSGQVTFTVPVVVASTTFTVSANDMGLVKGSTTQALQESTAASTPVTVNIS